VQSCAALCRALKQQRKETKPFILRSILFYSPVTFVVNALSMLPVLMLAQLSLNLVNIMIQRCGKLTGQQNYSQFGRKRYMLWGKGVSEWVGEWVNERVSL
jgi:hypothetical protein